MSSGESQKTLREKLAVIRADTSLSAQEKGRLCQEAMAAHHAINARHHETVVDNLSETCSHYNKKCSNFRFDCCNIIDPCHRCHAERGTCSVMPPQISEICCTECSTKQPPAASCAECGVKFSRNYCPKCFIWTPKQIVHCDDCGICRVGVKEEMFHCHNCDCCFLNTVPHQCAARFPRDARCMVCQELLYTSQRSTIDLPCHHFIHTHCCNELLRNNEFKCPTCRRSMVDMSRYWNELRTNILLQPLPDSIFNFIVGSTYQCRMGEFKIESEYSLPCSSSSATSPERAELEQVQMYRGVITSWALSGGQQVRAVFSRAELACFAREQTVWCNDCASKSKTQFHFLGLECANCHSFNTIRDD